MRQIQDNLRQLAGKPKRTKKAKATKPAKQEERRPRSRSAKHKFVQSGPHQDWTNAFSRMTV